MSATHAVLKVPSVSCSHCKAAIEDAVRSIDGVQRVDVDVSDKSVAIDFEADDVSLERLEAAIEDEGYKVAGRTVT